MTATWLIADPHFGHKRMYSFKKEDGSPVRPFADAEEADEYMIKQWNCRVRENDLVYVLGDVAMTRKGLKIIERLKGRKRLVSGNHDVSFTREYMTLRYFERIYGCVPMKDILLTHIPVHPDQLRRFGHNIHGHTHHYKVMERGLNNSWEIEDKRYLCVSVEHTDYAPITLEEAKERLGLS